MSRSRSALALTRPAFKLVSRLRPFDYEVEIWSHPALVGNRLYLRSQKEVGCLLLSAE